MKGSGNRIVIHMSGKDKSDGDFSLNDFTKQLDLFQKALTSTIKNVVSPKERLRYIVVELRKQSPAQVVVEIQSNNHNQQEYGELAVDSFFTALDSISNNEWPEQFDYSTLESYKNLFSLERKNKLNVGFSRNGEQKIEGQGIVNRIDDLIGPMYSSYGTWSGMFDALNFHGEKFIYIYPTVDFPRIQCVIPESLTGKIAEAINRYVTVYGEVFYHPKAKGGIPIKIKVERIDVQPSVEELPNLSDLKGINFDTGGLDSVDFVRKIRDEW